MLCLQVLLISTLAFSASGAVIPINATLDAELAAPVGDLVPNPEIVAIAELIEAEIPEASATQSEIDRRATSQYAPKKVDCPSTNLVRPATGLSSEEQAYIGKRKSAADVALKKWLGKTNAGFGTNGSMPTLALSTSGGGYRSFLLGAGVIQAFDDRDTSLSTSGLYQALTYHSGLSGGSWLISSLAGHNYPTVSSLKQSLWSDALNTALFNPGFLISKGRAVVSDILAKRDAGFSNTLTDVWGRLLSYKLLGPDGAAGRTLSSLTSLSSFTSFNVPYPVIIALGVKVFNGDCGPAPDATTYEFTPHEFGSWDSEVSAFVQTSYLGTSLENGRPNSTTCIQGFDNLGYVLGTSSSLSHMGCTYTKDLPKAKLSPFAFIAPVLEVLRQKAYNSIIDVVDSINARDGFASYPNPFYKYTSSSSTPNHNNDISKQRELTLVDGGVAWQNNPIFPFLQPSRNIDVILVNDNSADTVGNFPNGSEILTTYVQAFNHAGLSDRMPAIPTVETFLDLGLNKRATVFGCDDPKKTTIIYLPNEAFSYPSGTETLRLQYDPVATDGMIGNGNKIATQGDDPLWGICLGCAIMKKSGQALPDNCETCFEKMCYRGPGAPH